MNPVKILFLAASPADTPPLRLDHEIRSITMKIRASDHPKQLNLVSAWAVRPDDLLQALNEHKPQIVHFSGHGVSPSGEIVLLDEKGQSKPISNRAIEALFKTLRDNIRVVVLNACYTKNQAKAITKFIDCAIGMKSGIGDQAAATFAASFYRAIGFGRSIQHAFEEGRLALMLEDFPEANTPEMLCKPGVDPSHIVLIHPTTPSRDSLIREYRRNIISALRNKSGKELKRIARIRTLNVCTHLNPQGKTQVLRFIYSKGLIETENPIVDLSGVDLSNVAAARSKLVKAKLTGANLAHADFTRATLTLSDLAHSNCEQANLSGADITYADLSDADLTGAHLRNANLSYANLGHAILRNVDLSGAKLRKADLLGADLEGAAERAGKVRAGTGFIEEERTLYEKSLYLFEVTGDSMEHWDILEGDYLVVRASNEWPNEGEIIVASYSTKPYHVIGDDAKERTVKLFLGKRGSIVRLLGWDEKILIEATDFDPLGKVETVWPTSPRRENRSTRKWGGLTSP